jgi:hypothetical protein
MIPNIYIEKSVSEHRQELQNEAEHERRLASLRHSSSSLIRCYVGGLGRFLVVLGSNLIKFEQHGGSAVYDL